MYTNKRGIISGWVDPKPSYLFNGYDSIGAWRALHRQHQLELEEVMEEKWTISRQYIQYN